MLFDLLAEPAALFPGKPAVIQGVRTVTYEELLRAAGALSGRLRNAGLGPGDTVAIQMPNSAELVAALFGLWRLGAAVLPLDPALKAAEVESYCALAGAKTVLRMGDGVVPPVETLLKSPGSIPPPRGGDDWTALLLLSSGSAGLPKLVPRTPRSIEAAACQFKTGLPCLPDDRVLGVLPFYHAAGLFNALLSTLERGATVYAEHFSPRQSAATIERERISVLIASPFMYRLLTETCFATLPDFSSLRIADSTTGPLSLGVVRGFENRFRVGMAQSYGMTETNEVAVTRPGKRLNDAGLVGKPYPSVAVSICDDECKPVAPGVVGSVWVRSPAAASGYFLDSGASTVTFRDGFVVTGDIGRIDESGDLFVLGRNRPTINVAGRKVVPVEVEACLRGHPAVADVRVAGAPGPDGYERLFAQVVRAADVTAQDLRDFCAQRLADFKTPRRIEFVETLSRGPLGKPRIGTLPTKEERLG